MNLVVLHIEFFEFFENYFLQIKHHMEIIYYLESYYNLTIYNDY